MDLVAIGNKVVIYGGTATKVYNDIRIVDSLDYQWKMLKDDTETTDFKARFGHSCNNFERYLVIFGGVGPYNKKMKRRSGFSETIMFDIETGKYCKFDGGKTSLQAEISESKAKKTKLQESTKASGWFRATLTDIEKRENERNAMK